MKSIVAKAILFYTTIVAIMITICGIESIYDNGYFTANIVICIALIYACNKVISVEDLNTLTLNRYLEKKIKGLNN